MARRKKPATTSAMAAPMFRRASELRRYIIGAADGDIGSVEDVYFDDQGWTVRYLVVDTGTWLPGRQVLISPAFIRAIDAGTRRLTTDLTREQVTDSPHVDTAKPVSRQHELEFAAYYGQRPYWAGPYRWGAVMYPAALVAPEYPSAPGVPERVAEEMVARERQSHDAHLRSAKAVSGYGIQATDGELGHVEDFLVDEESWAIRYLIVDPRNWWPGQHVVISTEWITGVSWEESTVQVDVNRETVRDAPRYDPSGALDRTYETCLHGHYRRRGYWDRRPESWMLWPPAA